MKRKYFKYHKGKLSLPVFFPDATKAVIKTLDFSDVELTKTPGVLVNTYHLWKELGKDVLENFGGIGKFMSWNGGIISDSGGFQVMSLIKNKTVKGKVVDEGVVFYPSQKKKIILTPEKSIQFQMQLRTDMVVVLDDFTDPKSDYKEAKESVDRTIDWAKRSKKEFEKYPRRPYLLGVVQGGRFQDLRKKCAGELVKIGFDGLGYGGWPIDSEGKFDYLSAKTIADNCPDDYFLYGLGIGKPDEIVKCANLGYNIFDCVLPTRDGRHGRLYVYNADSISNIDVHSDPFYSFYIPAKEKYCNDNSPVSTACDCLLCRKYSRGYLAHLFRMKDVTAMRLASIHNLRFYAILMEKLGY
ncbi:MAG: tRNA guanosine(34) transglycosylase Tgt [bacterium]|nr:tRNA guanosine(34) transglycosylase Tgt [bacterium]